MSLLGTTTYLEQRLDGHWLFCTISWCSKVDLRSITTNTFCSELSREKMWARIHLIPLLQAEEDRDQVRRYYADKAREKDLLGAETKVYHGERFVRPTFTMTPEVSK
jgi:hypothetical protein